MRRHAISLNQLTALAQGRGGVALARRLAAARLSKTLLLIRDIVHMRHEQAELTRQAYASLARTQRRAAGAVRAILSYPAVGAWALECAMASRGREPGAARPAELAAVAAAAAVRGSVPTTLALRPQRGSVLWLPSLGMASVPNAAGEVTFRSSSDGSARLSAGGTIVTIPADPSTDGPNWRGIRRISCHSATRRLDLWLDGNVSRATPPELTPVRRLSDPVEVNLWRERLTGGWRLLAADHPAVAGEIAEVIRVIAPLAARPADPTSATLGDAFGCVVMSLPGDDVLAAVTLLHEARHTMLSALMDLLPLVDFASAARFYAPWRADPRPAAGVLHGLYAHLGVTAFWRRHRWRRTLDPSQALEAHVQFARWGAACREAAGALLDSGLLTPAGRHFVLAMRQQLDQWQDEWLPPHAVFLARQQAEEHRARWTRRWSRGTPATRRP